MAKWYNRPLVFVRDCHVALDFYVGKLGFTEAWRHEEKGRLLIVQVERDGTELILTEQWAERAGQGVMFISLESQVAEGLEAKVEALREEFHARGAETHEGWWGYRLLVMKDPDGNELWFPYPAEQTGP